VYWVLGIVYSVLCTDIEVQVVAKGNRVLDIGYLVPLGTWYYVLGILYPVPDYHLTDISVR
jgi:hypothetical protein